MAAEKYRALAETAGVGLLVVDSRHGVVEVNETLRRWFPGIPRAGGYCCYEALDLMPKGRQCMDCPTVETFKDGLTHEAVVSSASVNGGRTMYFKLVSSPLTDANGRVSSVMEVFFDITQAAHAQSEFLRVKRALKAINQCSQVITRAESERQLLNDVCRLIVTTGGYRMAWVGYRMDDEAKNVVPVAVSGLEDGYLREIKLTWSDHELGRGPVGTSIRTGRTSIVRDVQSDGSFQIWRQHALSRGFSSIIALPILCGTGILGALAVYSNEVDAFDAEEVELLDGFAKDLSFGVTTIRERIERRRAEAALKEAHEKLELRVAQRTAELTALNEKLEMQIIERKQAEADLLVAKDLAERANRAKSEFLSRMSHELRTPLNAILGFSQLLEADIVEMLTESQMENVREIIKAGGHLLELINEVLDLSRIETGKLSLAMETVGVAPALDECLSLIAPIAEQKLVRIERNTAACDEVLIKADRTRFKQVVLNLLVNAVKYGPEGGRVLVECAVEEGGGLRISVSDEGPGISSNMMKHLFEPFNRLGLENSRIEGTGIGLTISKRLMELMGGFIDVESAPENGFDTLRQRGFDPLRQRGSRFSAVFPSARIIDGLTGLTPRTLEAAPTVKGVRPLLFGSLNLATNLNEQNKRGLTPLTETPLTPLTARRITTILYIEDNSYNLLLVKKMLSRYPGIEVLEAPDASLGIELARAHRPDLILMDINLPGMDGYTALKRLKEYDCTRDIPVIAVSAEAMPGDILKGIEAGFHNYLTKPVNIKKFMEAVAEATGAMTI
jgi:signal transduction histidine kinase/ActR/RegA family two-component response regulator